MMNQDTQRDTQEDSQQNTQRGTHNRLRSRPKRSRGPRVQITLNKAGERNLRTIRKFFNDQIGTEVSDTLVVRRSLELFAAHLTDGWDEKDTALEEMTGLTRQMN